MSLANGVRRLEKHTADWMIVYVIFAYLLFVLGNIWLFKWESTNLYGGVMVLIAGFGLLFNRVLFYIVTYKL